jgi:5-methylcytosine-specific restriction endonuclease McrA
MKLKMKIKIKYCNRPRKFTELEKCALCRCFSKLTDHHKVRKSEGGKSGKYNKIRLCRWCHNDVEKYNILYEAVKYLN